MEVIKKAAQWLREAEALVISAGAGMGVDSGLPDFRGDTGFWQAYPMYERLGLSFVGAANPRHFEKDPAFGWGFYGHRLNLYRKTIPHPGFHLLLKWIEQFQLPYFVETSNVDGQFQKAGFASNAVSEIHGSIHHLQCLEPCHSHIWENEEQIAIDLQSMRAGSIPACPECGGVARPNILMFGDWSWLSERSQNQENHFRTFLNQHRYHRLLIIEMGAGTAIPSIRHRSESLGSLSQARVIRINPRESQISRPHLGLAMGALEALEAIDGEAIP